jgi:hypothetical protein
MGGRGSGRQESHGFMVDKCHEYKSIDIAWLHRQKLLQMGRTSTITWSFRDKQTGSIGIARLPGGIRLNYRQRSHGEEWHDIADFIPIVETATNFGGHRQWFQCPSCRYRCRILYGGALFRCRRCHRLKYDTQYEPSFARAATRALKIRERLGGVGGLDDLFPPKPKGMHWRTYERLQAREKRMQEAWAIGIARKSRMFERDVA